MPLQNNCKYRNSGTEDEKRKAGIGKDRDWLWVYTCKKYTQDKVRPTRKLFDRAPLAANRTICKE